MFVFVTFSYIFPVEIRKLPTCTGRNRYNIGIKVSLFVTKKKKYIQKHYITIRYPVKSGQHRDPDKE